MTYRDVAGAQIGGTEPIPLIEDLLGAWSARRFNIDLKDVLAIRPMMDVLRRTGAWDRVCVTSFSARLAGTRRGPCWTGRSAWPCRRPGWRPCGWPAASPSAVTALAERLARTGVHCAQIPGRIATTSFIRKAHGAGLQVHVWTLNRRSDMEHALDLGADGIMTDETVLLRDLLTERGLWPS